MGLPFYLCLCTRVMACICASAYVRGLGSGTQEYTRWNLKCVFWASIGQGMSPKLTVTISSGLTRVCVMSNSRWWVLMQGAPRGLLFITTCVQIYKYTQKKHTNTCKATCLSLTQHGSNVCVSIGVCCISARRSEIVVKVKKKVEYLLGGCLDNLWQVFGGVLLRSVVSLWRR